MHVPNDWQQLLEADEAVLQEQVQQVVRGKADGGLDVGARFDDAGSEVPQEGVHRQCVLFVLHHVRHRFHGRLAHRRILQTSPVTRAKRYQDASRHHTHVVYIDRLTSCCRRPALTGGRGGPAALELPITGARLEG